MTGITRKLAEFASDINLASLPPAVAARTCALVMDQFGIAVRARSEAEIADPLARALARLGLGASAGAGRGATVVGDAGAYPAPAAAFFNANLGHALDFDDTHARGSIHPSAPIVWAALAAGEMSGAHGRDVIAGITAGYEIQIRLSIALDPPSHYSRGFHPTATCGVFGAAAAAGRVLGLSADTIASALGLAGSNAAGSMQFLADGAWNKPYHTGLAAMGGLFAATFADAGYRGAGEAIEGKAGFLNAYAPHPDHSAATAGLGHVWETLQIAVKPYPSCRYGHAAMDALMALRTEHGLRSEDIASVEVGLPRTGWNIIGDPDTEKRNPGNYVDGQFSMPFVAAVALRDGAMDWDSYARHLADPETMSLCRRVRTVTDPQAEASYPAHMAGAARVTLTGGATLEKFIEIARGEPENFLTDEELRVKFDNLVAGYLPTPVRDGLAAGVLGLDTIADVRQLMDLVRPVAATRLAAAGSGD